MSARIFFAVIAASGIGCFGLQGCSPDTFTYYESVKNHAGGFDCHVLSPYGTVENSGDSIIVNAGGKVSARKNEITFQETECFVAVQKGDAAAIRIRTTDYGDSLAPGIALVVGRDKSFVQINNGAPRPIASRLGPAPTRVRFFSEGRTTEIMVGCDTVYAGKTLLPATDIVSFESVDSSVFSVRGLWSGNIRAKNVRFKAGSDATTGSMEPDQGD